MSAEARTRAKWPHKTCDRGNPLLVCEFPKRGFCGGNTKLESREIIVKTSFLMLSFPNRPSPQKPNGCRRLAECLVFWNGRSRYSAVSHRYQSYFSSVGPAPSVRCQVPHSGRRTPEPARAPPRYLHFGPRDGSAPRQPPETARGL